MKSLRSILSHPNISGFTVFQRSISISGIYVIASLFYFEKKDIYCV